MFSFEINVLCDTPDCPHGAIVTSEPLSWADLRTALETAANDGWLVDVENLTALCPACRVAAYNLNQTP